MDATASARFALIIEFLCRAVAARGAQSGAGGGFASIFRRAYAGPLTILLWTRLRRAATRFTILAANLQKQGLHIEAPQTNPRRARIRKPRPAPARVTPALPRRFAWLLAPVPEAASSASQLRHLLAEPGMQELIAADPRFGRILRPLCHMIGIRQPPFLRLARTGPSAAPVLMRASHDALPPPAPAAVSHPPVRSVPAAFTPLPHQNEQRAPPSLPP